MESRLSGPLASPLGRTPGLVLEVRAEDEGRAPAEGQRRVPREEGEVKGLPEVSPLLACSGRTQTQRLRL